MPGRSVSPKRNIEVDYVARDTRDAYIDATGEMSVSEPKAGVVVGCVAGGNTAASWRFTRAETKPCQVSL